MLTDMRSDGEENGTFTWDVEGTSRSNLSQEDVGDDPHWENRLKRETVSVWALPSGSLEPREVLGGAGRRGEEELHPQEKRRRPFLPQVHLGSLPATCQTCDRSSDGIVSSPPSED